MNLEFIARANTIVLELEKHGLHGTAVAMRQVVADYELSERQAQMESLKTHQFEATSRT